MAVSEAYDTRKVLSPETTPTTYYSAVGISGAGLVLFGVFTTRVRAIEAVKRRVKEQLPKFWTTDTEVDGRYEMQLKDDEGYPIGLLVIYPAVLNELQ